MSRFRQSAGSQAPRDTARGASSPSAPFVAGGDERHAVAGVAADFSSGHRIDRHRHRRAQLVYAVEGVMTVETQEGLWVVPPLRALWVPAGVVHSIRMTGRVRMRTLYFDDSAAEGAALPSRCAVLAVSPLLRELVVRVVEGTKSDTADAGDRRRQNLLAVLFDELHCSTVAALELPLPRDANLRRICDALVADPADQRDAAAWARVAAMSERTLARRFPEGTGMTLLRWRQQLRLLRALERLAAGDAVTAIAVDLGYASSSAFVKLFRESLGTTPARFFAEPSPDGSRLSEEERRERKTRSRLRR